MAKLNVGDRVVVTNTLMYNGRVGVLEPATVAEDGGWDFHVNMDANSASEVRQEGGIIGVWDFQVRAI